MWEEVVGKIHPTPILENSLASKFHFFLYFTAVYYTQLFNLFRMKDNKKSRAKQTLRLTIETEVNFSQLTIETEVNFSQMS